MRSDLEVKETVKINNLLGFVCEIPSCPVLLESKVQNGKLLELRLVRQETTYLRLALNLGLFGALFSRAGRHKRVVSL